MKSFKARVILVTGTSYLVSAFKLVSFIILANRLSQGSFGQLIFILTAVLLVSDLCDFGTGNKFILRMRSINREDLRFQQTRFLELRLGTVILMIPVILAAGVLIVGLGFSFLFTILVITTYVRNSIATVVRSEESYVRYFLLLSGEQFIFVPLVLISDSNLKILLLGSLFAIAVPLFMVYPSILKIKPHISLTQTLKQFRDAGMNGIAGFVTNVALLFPMVIKFFCGEIAFSNYIFLIKIFSPIPTLGTSIALINLSSKEKLNSRLSLKKLSSSITLLCLFPLIFFLPNLISNLTSEKYNYSYFNVITILIVALAYFVLHILVSDELILMHFSKIISGYVVFIATFILLIVIMEPGLNLQLLLICELLAITVALCYFVYQKMRRHEEPHTN